MRVYGFSLVRILPSLYWRIRVSEDPYPCIFYAVNDLISLQFFKVGEYGHIELHVFPGLCWCELAGGI